MDLGDFKVLPEIPPRATDKKENKHPKLKPKFQDIAKIIG